MDQNLNNYQSEDFKQYAVIPAGKQTNYKSVSL